MTTLTVAASRYHSPFGELLLVAKGGRLARIVLPGERSQGESNPSHPVLKATAIQLDEYFTGARQTFDLPLDLQAYAPFHLKVAEALRSIPFGETRTYAEIAALAGSPKAVRAVGTACARNHLPIVVPCHRVLRSDGSIGGYRGGEELKRALLEFERGHALR